MSTKKQPSKSASRSSLTVPELDQSKMAVLNMLASAHSRRSYKHATDRVAEKICPLLDSVFRNTAAFTGQLSPTGPLGLEGTIA